MEKIVLDFANCKNAIDMHHELKATFNFPDYYGENLSALWDCLSYRWDRKECITVIIRGQGKVSKEWQAYMEEILEVFRDVHEETPNVTFIVES